MTNARKSITALVFLGALSACSTAANSTVDPDANGLSGDDADVDAPAGPPVCSIAAPAKITQHSNSAQGQGALLWTGSDYVGFLHDTVLGGPGGYFKRFSNDGIQQGNSVLAIPAGLVTRSVSNGTGYAVTAVMAPNGQNGLYVATFDDNGQPLVAPVAVMEPLSEFSDDIVWTGNEYGIVGCAQGMVRFSRRSSTGSAVGPLVDLGTIGPRGEALALAWSGNEYAVAWKHVGNLGNAPGEVFFTRLNTDGAIVQTVKLGESLDQGGPTMAWSGTEYVVAWVAVGEPGEGPRVVAQRVSATGVALGSLVEIKTLGLVASGVSIPPNIDIAFEGGRYAVAWVSNELDVGGYEVYVAELDASLQKLGQDTRVTDEGARTAGATAGSSPRLAWNGTRFAVSWNDFLATGSQPAAWNLYAASVCP